MNMKKKLSSINPTTPLKKPIFAPTKKQKEFYSNRIPKPVRLSFYKLINDEVHSKYESIYDIDINDEFITNKTPKGSKLKAITKAYINVYGLPVIGSKIMRRRDRHDDGGVQQGI